MKISDVLWKAANRHLASRSEYDKDTATCLAVLNVEGLRLGCGHRSRGVTFGGWCRKHSPAVGFLYKLGLPMQTTMPFRDIKDFESRQGARYAWLMFASMYAAELEARGEL